MTSPLVGVWEPTWATHQGLVIFTETHFCELLMARERAIFKDESAPTEAEAAVAFKTVSGGAGTYSISGSTIISNRENNVIPNRVGHPEPYEFSIEDDQLTVTSRTGATAIFRRVA